MSGYSVFAQYYDELTRNVLSLIHIFLVSQVDLSENEPTGEDLYKIGVIARIKQVIQHSDDGVKLHVEGICRGEISSLAQEDPFLLGNIVKSVSYTHLSGFLPSGWGQSHAAAPNVYPRRR